MDMVDGFFGIAPARRPFLIRARMCAPFAVRVADGAPMTLIAPAAGPIVVTCASGDVEVPARSVCLVRGRDPWTFADSADRPHSAVIHPGHRCETLEGEPLGERWSLGVRTWGNTDGDDATHLLLVGVFESLPESARLLLDELPTVVSVPADAVDAALLDTFSTELGRDAVAQTVVLERMLDLLAAFALRHWIESVPANALGLARGLTDPCVGAALRLMHADPACSWTVGALARDVGVSRAAFAKRFTDLVGRSPIAHLTDWRMALAADALVCAGAPVGEIAAGVGYQNAFAFSTAFKRHHGISPHRYRSRARADAAASTESA